MQAGKLNSRVTLAQRVGGADSWGQPMETWVDLASMWADIRFQSGMAALRGDATVAVARASVRIRYRTDVLPGMRLRYGATVFDIKASLPSGREYVDLVCEVVT